MGPSVRAVISAFPLSPQQLLELQPPAQHREAGILTQFLAVAEFTLRVQLADWVE